VCSRRAVLVAVMRNEPSADVEWHRYSSLLKECRSGCSHRGVKSWFLSDMRIDCADGAMLMLHAPSSPRVRRPHSGAQVRKSRIIHASRVRTRCLGGVLGTDLSADNDSGRVDGFRVRLWGGGHYYRTTTIGGGFGTIGKIRRHSIYLNCIALHTQSAYSTPEVQASH
jgi:hypothetical protein